MAIVFQRNEEAAGHPRLCVSAAWPQASRVTLCDRLDHGKGHPPLLGDPKRGGGTLPTQLAVPGGKGAYWRAGKENPLDGALCLDVFVLHQKA